MTTFKVTHMLFSVMVSLALAVFTFAADPNTPTDSAVGSAASIGSSNDQQPGSVLVFNYYKSGAVIDPSENTKISITNTNQTQIASIHLFFVANSCQISDAYLCLTANQTATFLVSDIDPGVTGYAIAIATDFANGVPIGYNFLIGSEHIKLASGHQAKLNAVSFQARFEGRVPSPNPDFAVIKFDGVRYNKAPRALGLEHIPSAADGNSTFLVVNSISGSLVTGAATIGSLFGILYDDAENAFSFALTGECQLSGILSNTFPRTSPRFSQVISAGRSGWIKLMSPADRAITGAAIDFNSSSITNLSSFTGGSNLHHLSNTNGVASLTVPVFPPAC